MNPVALPLRRTARGAELSALVSMVIILGAFPAGATHVDPGDIITVLPPDRIPAIMAPTFDPDDSWLSPSDRVVGVVVGAEARAYPIKILSWHEIVNDWFGDIPIAVTYCPLCGTGIAFDRTVGGEVLAFKVSGKLYKNDLVMYDTASESLWSQLLGEAIQGSLHGARLIIQTAVTMAWSEWEQLHPDTKLLARPMNPDGTFERSYESDPYADYYDSASILFPRGNVDTETGLHPKEFVLGVVVGGRAKAYPFRFLVEDRVVNDVVADEPIVVTFTRDTGRAFLRAGGSFTWIDDATMRDDAGVLYDLLTGRAGPGGVDLVPLEAKESFWFAWFDFFPDTDIYRIGRGPASSPDQPMVAILFSAVAIAVALAVAVFLVRRRLARRAKRDEETGAPLPRTPLGR